MKLKKWIFIFFTLRTNGLNATFITSGLFPLLLVLRQLIHEEAVGQVPDGAGDAGCALAL